MFKPRKPYASQQELDAQQRPYEPVQDGDGPEEANEPPDPSDPNSLNDADDMTNGGDAQQGMDLVARDPEIRQRPGMPSEPTDKVEMFAGRPIVEADAPVAEEVRRRHEILMASLKEEGERQAEERQQAQIDDDYYHHQQWKPEEARVLMERGQAPLVYNEARGAIEWLTGTERKLRKDYKIRPRSADDEQAAELKTKAFKYLEDVNLAPWHRSRAFKDMVIGGLGWLEESVNTDPEKEMIYCGSEDWRRVFRDSRGREFDQSDWRYIHRRKILDLDYAVALLPKAAAHLTAIAGRWGSEDDETDDVWYLGQRLTSAHAAGWYTDGQNGLYGEDYTLRRAGAHLFDHGRRKSVEVIETWYRVPQRVKVFAAGPHFRKVVNPADPAHQQAITDGYPLYETVKFVMRCMVGTQYRPCWDGPSPFRHNRFPLIAMWGYVRRRDGMVYGAMRGMRDPQDDLNKRKSKALYALSATRTIFKEGAFDDVEDARQEIARVDTMLSVNDINNVKIDSGFNAAQVQGNLEMAQADIEHIRNIGGVTGENLGHDTNATSGKAILARQDQGSMTTYELFDNLFLAFKIAGQMRLSNIEQFCNQPWQFRLDPTGNKPAEWVTVNRYDPATGRYLDDITANQADFIVDQQDYRATLSQAAMDSMFQLLTQMANFAPQIVLNLMDLVVDNSDVPGKDEWVARIRKMTGQRDPSKSPSPEEQAQDQQAAQQQQQQQAITMGMAQAQLDLLKKKVTSTNADAVLKSLQGLLAAVEAAASIATVPGLAPVADKLALSAGFQDATPSDPVVPGPTTPIPPAQPGGAPGAPGAPGGPPNPGIPPALPAPGAGSPQAIPGQ